MVIVFQHLISLVQMPHRPDTKIAMRMAIHSGPAKGVVVGARTRVPNYSVLSATVEEVRHLEKMGEGGRIHLSETTKRLLDMEGGYPYQHRGEVNIVVSNSSVLQDSHSY